MKRSIGRSTKPPSSQENETRIQDNKPMIKEKPKGGWMKLLRKMSINESPDDIQQMAGELSDDNLEMSPPEKPRKQKQVAAVRIPSAISGQVWMGVVAEFKGRSVDDESQDEVETF